MHIPIARPELDEQEISAVTKVLRSGMLSSGPVVATFEKQFAVYSNTKYAIALNNGTSSLHSVLLASGVGPGDEVIVPAFTFFATASAVNMCGARPVFADVSEDFFTINPECVNKLITPRTKAVIGVHLFGHPFDIDEILEICSDHNLTLIEDAAQAHGALYKGKKVGSFGLAGCFSFYPTKNMTTGEGGMVTTDDIALADRIRKLINHGQRDKYIHTGLGFNYRMTDIAAAIGVAQLSKLDRFNRSRNQNADYLTRNIKKAGIVTPKTARGVYHVFHQYVVKITEECDISRQDLMDFLREKGVSTAIHYPVPVPRQPFYLDDYVNAPYPISEKLSGLVLSLPIHPLVTDTDRRYLCQIINEVS